MADLNKLVDELSALTVLEAAELSKLLEEKWGVSAAAAVAAAGPAGGAAAPAAEEQTEFDVILTGDGGKKINVIKEVRAITELGLAKPRPWSSALRRPSRKASTRTKPRRSRSSSKKPAGPSSSSKLYASTRFRGCLEAPADGKAASQEVPLSFCGDMRTDLLGGFSRRSTNRAARSARTRRRCGCGRQGRRRSRHGRRSSGRRDGR